jgi:LuxR family maltose regulon positive regulatory protein
VITDTLLRAQVMELQIVLKVRPALTHALPHLAVQARIELARCHLALSDVAAAQILLQEVTEVLTLRPGLGVFAGQADNLRAELAQARGSFAPGASALTGAELRLLPMLSTHLSFPEMAGEMFLSPNTVKSQAISIYRKLGASSRSQAVARSRELGLLEGRGRHRQLGNSVVLHPLVGDRRARMVSLVRYRWLGRLRCRVRYPGRSQARE